MTSDCMCAARRRSGQPDPAVRRLDADAIQSHRRGLPRRTMQTVPEQATQLNDSHALRRHSHHDTCEARSRFTQLERLHRLPGVG
jgi:hypothetical protein